MDLKKPFSFHDQMLQLKKHNMIIVDEQYVEDFLSSVNYYRFTGYALQCRKSPADSDYVDGTTFEQIQQLYLFDIDLRHVLHKYLEKVELLYRTKISYHFAMQKCIAPPYDQHYDVNNYYLSKDIYDMLLSFQQRGTTYYKDTLIVQHHIKKYGNKFPLWVLVEMLSFSDLSRLYGGMYDSDQDIIANSVGTGRAELKNHLHCLTFLRNKCAHGARLYNASYVPSARLSPSFLRAFPQTRNDSLFAYLLVLVKRLPSDADKLDCIKDIDFVVRKYLTTRDLALIGFPQNFKSVFEKYRY